MRRIFEILCLATPFLGSIIFIPFLNNPFEFSKYIFLLTSSYLLVLFWFKLNLLSSLFIKIKESILSQIVLFYVLVVFISDLFGLDPIRSIMGGPVRYQGFLALFSVVVLFLSVQQIRKSGSEIVTFFSKYASLVILGMGSLSVIGFVLNNYLHIPFAYTHGKLHLTFGNPIFLGCFLVMLLPFILNLKTNSKRKTFRFKIVTLVTLQTLIFMTFSSSAIFASLIIYVFWSIKKGLKLRAFVLTITIVAGILLFLQKTNSLSHWDNRQIITLIAIEKIQQSSIVGYGQENFELIFPKNLHYNVDSSHNILLENLLSTGIIGLLPFLLIVFLGLRRGMLEVRLSIMAFLVMAFFNPLSLANIAFFWFLLGLNNKIIEAG